MTDLIEEVEITIETTPTMTKTNNPYYGRVVKRTTMTLLINKDYGEYVNERRKEESVKGKFKPKDRPWGAIIPNCPLIEHNGEYYLSGIVISEGSTPTYYLDLKTMSESLYQKLKPFLPKKKEQPRQKLEDEVITRTIKLSSIVRIAYAEETYDLT